MRLTTEDIKWLRIASTVTFTYDEENGSIILCEGKHYKDDIYGYIKEWEHEIKIGGEGKPSKARYQINGINHIWNSIKHFLKAGHEVKLHWEIEKIEEYDLQKSTLFISANLVDKEIGVFHYNTFILESEVSPLEKGFITST